MRGSPEAFSGDAWRSLQRMLALDNPVLVLGPGCQRIGYDRVLRNRDRDGRPDGSPWAEVTRRMRHLHALIDDSERPFLDQIWRSKLSDETRARWKDGELGDEIDLADRQDPPPASEIEALRMEIARRILTALINCTRCLGGVVSTGETPVISWQAVQHPPDGTGESARWREAAARVLEEASAIARAAYHLMPGNPVEDEDERWLVEVGIPYENPKTRAQMHEMASVAGREFRQFLDVLDVEAIAGTTGLLVRSCLRGRTLALSGARVEWLADLFWHVISCDSGVPPSQADLAFLVNLRALPSPRRRTFTRARPGEYRGERSGRLKTTTENAALTKKITDRMAFYPDGREKKEDWVGAADNRLLFVRTMAATLLTTWATRSGGDPPPVALVSSYDLTLERQLMRSASAGEAFHVIVPVWVTDHEQSRRLDWLWGTYKRVEEAYDARSHSLGEPSWRWYPERDELLQIDGPIIFKVNGSPLLHLSDDRREVATGDLRLDSQDGRRKGTVELATIFSEYDSLASIVRFSDTQGGFAKLFIESHLSWEKRSWLFLGDGFPDWIPRLRLLFTARTSLGGTSDVQNPRMDDANAGERPQFGAAPRSTQDQRIALDRAFDWPEIAILDALDVVPYEVDLARLIDYPKDIPQETSTKNFLIKVQERLR